MGAFRIQEKRAADAALFPRTQQLVPGITAHQAVSGNAPGCLETLDRRGGVGPIDTVRPAGIIAQSGQRCLYTAHGIAAAGGGQQWQRQRRAGDHRRRHRRLCSLRARQGLKGEIVPGTAGGVHIAVALDGGNAVLLLQVCHQFLPSTQLGVRHGLAVKAALEADAQAVVVIVPGVGAHGVLRTAAVDRAVLADEKVITDPRPPVGQVPLVDLLRRTCHRRGVVQDDAAGGRPTGQLARPLIGNFIDLHFCLPPLPLFQRWPSDASTACVKSPAPGRPAPPRFPGWRSIR